MGGGAGWQLLRLRDRRSYVYMPAGVMRWRMTSEVDGDGGGVEGGRVEEAGAEEAGVYIPEREHSSG